MLRSFLIYSVLILLSLAQPAFAQEVIGVRTGEHKDYSRLVFDWNKQVQYDLDTSTKGQVKIKFKKNASIKDKAGLSKALKNFSSFKVISEKPLTVSISVPKDSRTRAFFAGDRLVVDVYNSPSGEKPSGAPVQQAKAEPKEKPKPEKKAPPKQEEKPPEPSAEKLKEVEIAKAVPRDGVDNKAEEKIDVAAAQEPEKTEPEPEKELPKIKKEDVKPSNLISFSSTKAFGLAVFEMNKELWLINDQNDVILSPQVTGPDADHFTPITKLELDRGIAFRTKMLPGAYVRSEGGGLLWRIIVSDKERKEKPIATVRKAVEKGRTRSGHVLFTLKTAQKIIDVVDPVRGVTLKVVTVDNPKDFAGAPLKFIDFETLPSAVGLVILPKVDDLEVEIIEGGVKVSRPGGLTLTSQSKVKAALAKRRLNDKKDSVDPATKAPNIYDFKNWELGGLAALEENSNVILSELNDLPDGKKLEDIITLAKMYLANGLAPESLGFLKLAQSLLPGIENNSEFKALKAAAYSLVSKSESAFSDLSSDDLKKYGDIPYWRAFALADLGDWQQAEEILPTSLSPIQDYPKYIYNRIAPGLAEVALRAGNVAEAERLLARLEDQDDLWEPQKAALQYLKGEAERQKGNADETRKIWKELVGGKDDLYRARAGLALTRLDLETGKITKQEAIDDLEHLRYAWRGDYLEAQINYWLGKTYFANNEYARGLNILREAASYAIGTPLSRRITSEMSDLFSDLFLSDKLSSVSPLDATALYEQFTELVPTGPQGDRVVEQLAERLVQADLLGRAADLLQHQIDHRLSGSEAHRVAVRLSAIKLLDDKPAEAIETLKKASTFLQSQPEEYQTPARYRELSLLRARGLSKQGRPDQALALLNDLDLSPDVNRLKADIAWNAGYWDDAAEALDDVILDMNISLTRPLDETGKQMILQRAVALNLAGDRIALANIREQYSDLMAQTDKAKVFEVITRARQSAALADRQTLLNVAAETDLFADFLNSYKTTPTPSN